MAQLEPPARVARLNHTEGRVMFLPAQAREWRDADLNRPLVPGDQLWADKGTRAEIQIGSAVIRIDGGTWLKMLVLADDATQLSVTQGSLLVHVRSLPEGENFEIDTSNLAYRTAYPGQARIDVDAARAITRVTIRSGAGAVYGERAQAVSLGDGQQMTFRGRSLDLVGSTDSPVLDNFDRWVAERDRREDQSLAAHYVPRELVGYQWLDSNGQWGQDPAFGLIWFPNAQPGDWVPYRQGRWEWIAPWGWTWIDDAPWAFATTHYGRWAMVGSRWAWAPGPLPLRPTYAPALVAFLGGQGGPTLTLGGRASIAWIPLAPGEPWQPGASATSVYLDGVNANMKWLPTTGYAYLHKPEAVSAMAVDDFAHGKPLHGGRAPLALPAAHIVPAPAAPAGTTDHALAPAQTQQQAKAEQARKAEQERSVQPPPAAPPAEPAKAKPATSPQSKAQPRKARVTEPARVAQQARPQQAKSRQVQRRAAARTEPGATRETKTASSSPEPRAKRTQPSSAKRSTAKKQKPTPATHVQQVEAARRAAEEAARRRAAQQERARREALQRQEALGG